MQMCTCLQDVQRCGDVMGRSPDQVGIVVLMIQLVSGVAERGSMRCRLLQDFAHLHDCIGLERSWTHPNVLCVTLMPHSISAGCVSLQGNI